MKVGIMQPYFLPYIGYFALINIVDKFVFLDDVQYIRRQGKGKSWVNRNRIKIVDDWHYITLPVQRASLVAKINQVSIVNDERCINKLKKSIEWSYNNAPNVKAVKNLIFNHILPGENISRLNILLTKAICNYLGIKTEFYVSSEMLNDTSLSKVTKIVTLCKMLNGNHYINPKGGEKLYSKEQFLPHYLELSFLEMNEETYPQGNGDFIPNLSILDVLMWNSVDHVKKMLQNYKLHD